MVLEKIAVDTMRTLEVQRAYQWRIQRVLNTGILVWTPILCAEINKKSHVERTKSSFPLYLNILSHLALVN